jgi:hypothetical protein
VPVHGDVAQRTVDADFVSLAGDAHVIELAGLAYADRDLIATTLTIGQHHDEILTNAHFVSAALTTERCGALANTAVRDRGERE